MMKMNPMTTSKKYAYSIKWANAEQKPAPLNIQQIETPPLQMKSKAARNATIYIVKQDRYAELEGVNTNTVLNRNHLSKSYVKCSKKRATVDGKKLVDTPINQMNI